MCAAPADQYLPGRIAPVHRTPIHSGSSTPIPVGASYHMSTREQRATSRAGRREEEDITITAGRDTNANATNNELFTLLQDVLEDLCDIRTTQREQTQQIAALQETINRFRTPTTVPEQP